MPTCVPWGSIGSNVCCEPPFAPIITTTPPVTGTNDASPVFSEATILYLTNNTQPANPADKRTFSHTMLDNFCTETGIANVCGNVVAGNTWNRRTWGLAQTLSFIPDTKGGTKAQVLYRSSTITGSGFFQCTGAGSQYSKALTNNIRIFYGIRPWFNSTTNQWYLVLQGTDCIGATCAPYFAIIDTEAWVLRVRPRATSGHTITQSGVYTCPNVTLDTSAGNPFAGFATGTPSLPGLNLDLHWRMTPQSGANGSYPFNGSTIVPHTHFMTFGFRNAFVINISTSTGENLGNWQKAYDTCCLWPSWPPSYPWTVPSS